MIVIGQDTCAACGHVEMMVAQRRLGRVTRCDRCGAKASRCAVWYPAEIWPETKALVQFDLARRRLRLPTLADAPWQ